MSILQVAQSLPSWIVRVVVVGSLLYVGLLMWRLAGRLGRAVVGKGRLKLWFGQAGEK